MTMCTSHWTPTTNSNVSLYLIAEPTKGIKIFITLYLLTKIIFCPILFLYYLVYYIASKYKYKNKILNVL